MTPLSCFRYLLFFVSDVIMVSYASTTSLSQFVISNQLRWLAPAPHLRKRWNKLRKQTKSQHPVDVAAKPQNPRVGENIDRTRANFFDTDVGGSRYRISILYYIRTAAKSPRKRHKTTWDKLGVTQSVLFIFFPEKLRVFWRDKITAPKAAVNWLTSVGSGVRHQKIPQ